MKWKSQASPGRWNFESQGFDPRILMEVRATWQLKMCVYFPFLFRMIAVSVKVFFSATPSEHLKNHDTGGLEPWNFMNFHRLGISSSLTIRHSYFSGKKWLNHQCLLRQRHKHHDSPAPRSLTVGVWWTAKIYLWIRRWCVGSFETLGQQDASGYVLSSH